MRLLRTIRFDASDERVFPLAAAADEWAVSGAFAFAEIPPERLTGKPRQAFASGFLGLGSFGRSTFVTVAEARPEEFEGAVAALAAHFVAEWGAPDLASATGPARDEVRFAAELAEGAPVNALLAVSRTFDEEGAINEAFRIIQAPGETPHARIWDIVTDEKRD